MRDVIQNEQYPDGPLLAPACNHDLTDPSAFTRAALDDLNKLFKGASVAIAGRAEEAKLFQDAGLKTYLLGEAKEIPAGVANIQSWKELSGQLAK